jgi:hypothetical protein
VKEDDRHVVFEFNTPYVIAATPPNNSPWGVYDSGCTNGLVLRGKVPGGVAVSTDRGVTWHEVEGRDGLDLTDRVKGHRQYWLRLNAGPKDLQGADLTITTVCQASPAVMPRLKDGGTKVTFHASGRALVSAGPTLPQAQAQLVEGKFGSPRVTLELAAPRGEPAFAVYAAAHVLSGNPPDPNVKYRIDASLDRGKSWNPLVENRSVTRRGDEPKDFWSQSLSWGSAEFNQAVMVPVRVRFSNTGGKAYARCEAHLAYRAAGGDATKVMFAWTDDRGEHRAEHTFPGGDPATWDLPTGQGVRTRWVEFTPVGR